MVAARGGGTADAGSRTRPGARATTGTPPHRPRPPALAVHGRGVSGRGAHQHLCPLLHALDGEGGGKEGHGVNHPKRQRKKHPHVAPAPEAGRGVAQRPVHRGVGGELDERVLIAPQHSHPQAGGAGGRGKCPTHTAVCWGTVAACRPRRRRLGRWRRRQDPPPPPAAPPSSGSEVASEAAYHADKHFKARLVDKDRPTAAAKAT